MATGLDGEIRKLRKKLRQIENLERMDRDLTEDEETKVSKRFELREKLHELLAQLPKNSAKVRPEESQAVLFTSESCSRSSTTETIQAEVSVEMKRQLEETQNGEVKVRNSLFVCLFVCCSPPRAAAGRPPRKPSRRRSP
ncbi:uncharacterized protein [Branchiostoma lanceolatum]|uniref:uncharacterized protein n=1 Tax=Branchiostoma lanceolatum TaxID=7740 RepID=UPI00345539DC